MEKYLLHNLRKGKIVFTLHGQKLKGDYALVRSSYQGENSWLLMKVKDKYAKTGTLLKKINRLYQGKQLNRLKKAQIIFGNLTGAMANQKNFS